MEQNKEVLCTQCNNPLKSDAVVCPKCGQPRKANPDQKTKPIPSKPKSGKIALALCILFGILGVHRFYVGKIATGFLMLFTLGLAGVWVVIDLILIVRNQFKDKEGRTLIVIEPLGSFNGILLLLGSLMIWIALFFVLASALISFTTQDLTNAVEKQLTALQKGEIEQVYAETSTSFKQTISIDKFKTYLEEFPILRTYQSLSFDNRKIIDNNGLVQARLINREGTPILVEFQLTKEEGLWKIVNIIVRKTQ